MQAGYCLLYISQPQLAYCEALLLQGKQARHSRASKAVSFAYYRQGKSPKRLAKP